MNIKGTHTLKAPIQTIWPMLQDPAVLARIAPGVSKIEALGSDRFKANSDISLGPVRGNFEGEIRIVDKVDHERMTLELDQKSKMGHAQANIIMMLAPTDDGQTQVAYNGSAKVSGRLASMGQRILGGVVNSLSKQVFSELDKILAEQRPEQSAEPASAPVGFLQRFLQKISSIWKSLFR